jgi:hypothetical protein
MSNFLRRGREHGGAPQVILAIVAVIILLVVAVVAVTFWVAANYFQVEITESDDGQQVKISTPFGELNVEGAEAVAGRLKLPIYPNAEPEDEGGSVRFHASLGNEEGGFSAAGAGFRTDDSIEEVDAWYREQLGPEFERKEGRKVRLISHEHSWGGEVDMDIDGIGYVSETDSLVRGVVLEDKGTRVEIGLFEFREAERQ